jgi:hypothetical protein
MRSSPSTHARRHATLATAMTFKAHVRDGRILLDEPTDLPDGAEVELETVGAWDELSDDGRREVEDALAASEEDLAAGRFVSAEELLTKLARRIFVTWRCGLWVARS